MNSFYLISANPLPWILDNRLQSMIITILIPIPFPVHTRVGMVVSVNRGLLQTSVPPP